MDYFFSIGLIATFVCVIYIFFPKRYFGEKSEYLIFFLSSISSFWLIYIVLKMLFGFDLTYYKFIGYSSLFIWITITHLLFPFKRTQRNKNFTFITLATTIVAFLIILCCIFKSCVGWNVIKI